MANAKESAVNKETEGDMILHDPSHHTPQPDMRARVISAATKLFLKKGFYESSVREIATAAGVNVSTMLYEFGSKEEILCCIVRYVIDGQFGAIHKLLEDKTDDKILLYAAETTLQLYIAESSDSLRSMYAAAYSLPKSTELIYHTITGKLEEIFKEHLPGLETKDFYELEIASAGVMRGFMIAPCHMYFTMDRKVSRFIETTFLIYRVSQEKIDEAVAFVSQFDWQSIAANLIEQFIKHLTVE